MVQRLDSLGQILRPFTTPNTRVGRSYALKNRCLCISLLPGKYTTPQGYLQTEKVVVTCCSWYINKELGPANSYHNGTRTSDQANQRIHKNRPQLKKSTKLGRCKSLFALSVASSNNWVKSYRPGSSGSLSMGSWAPQARPEPRASYKAGICVHAAHTKCWVQFHRWYPLAAQRAEGGRAHRWHAPTLEFSPVQMGSNRSRRIGVNCWACCAKWQWKAVSRQLSYRARARKSDERDDWMSTERTWYCACWAHWCVASWTKV